MPEWAQRERHQDLQWIDEHSEALTRFAGVAFREQGRGVVVVHVELQPKKGHLFGYFPQAVVDVRDDEETKRPWREIRDKGYSGSHRMVMLWAQVRQEPTERHSGRPRFNQPLPSDTRQTLDLPACAGYPIHPPAFLAGAGLGGRPTVIVVQPVQHLERNYPARLRLPGQ